MKELNVAIIGYKFMGKAHSHAYHTAPYIFDITEPVELVAVSTNRLEAGGQVDIIIAYNPDGSVVASPPADSPAAAAPPTLASSMAMEISRASRSRTAKAPATSFPAPASS